ncbi:conserved hypothetical protein [Ricinus communis]|uniref:RNase H type-1 domain-containing protein n=1 Tax=Ricinus communis TaxID=3988 RepID=B9SBA5_RICCO|nr:conserved hypothetical protein [Ricinus communis]
MDLYASWLVANLSQQSLSPATSSTSSIWSKPPHGMYKCNVDAVTFYGRTGFALVLRDHDGSFISASLGSSPVSVSPLVAEAMGLREVLTNHVAHVLARAPDSITNLKVWNGTPPPFLCDVLSWDSI